MITLAPDSLMEEIQQLQDTFGHVTNQAIVLTDHEGNVITRPTMGGRFYQIIYTSLEEGRNPFQPKLNSLDHISEPVVLEDWIPGMKYVIHPLAPHRGQVYFLWSGIYLEEGTKEWVIDAFERKMKNHAAYEQLLTELSAMPELSQSGIAEIRDRITVLGGIVTKLLAVSNEDPSDRMQQLLHREEQLKEGLLRLNEAGRTLMQCESLHELGSELLEALMHLPYHPSSALLYVHDEEASASTYFSRGWLAEADAHYVEDLKTRYSLHSFLSSAIINETAGPQLLVECPLITGKVFKGILSVGFEKQTDAEQWLTSAECAAGLACASLCILEKNAKYSKLSEVFLANLRKYLQNVDDELQHLSMEASCMAYDFARYIGVTEEEAQQIRTACLLAPFQLGLLDEYGFYKEESALLRQVDELASYSVSIQMPRLSSAAQVLVLVLRETGNQAEKAAADYKKHQWIDPSRYNLDSKVSAGIEYWLISSFQSFLRGRAPLKPKKKAITTIGLLSSSALKTPKEEWGITAREVEVLELIILGKTNKEIANALVISEHTVKNHLSRIFHKMNVTDRSQIIALVYKRILNSERIEM